MWGGVASGGLLKQGGIRAIGRNNGFQVFNNLEALLHTPPYVLLFCSQCREQSDIKFGQKKK